MKSIFCYWLPVVAWAWLIFYLSSIPSLESGLPGVLDWTFRKGAHIFVYAVLTFLLFRALHAGHAVKVKNAVLLAAVFAACYAFSDEFHQLYIPGRHGRVRDVAVDALGILLMVTILQSQQFSQKSLGGMRQFH